MRVEVPTMILPKVRDPRFVTIRRGGSLTDMDHRLLALWAAACAEQVLDLFESVQPEDPRPRQAIEHARAWVRGEVTMMQARAAGGHAMGAARDLGGSARHAAYAAGQAGAPVGEARPRGDVSAGGSVTSFRSRSASSCSTTSGCATTSAGQCSTVSRPTSRQHRPQAHRANATGRIILLTNLTGRPDDAPSTLCSIPLRTTARVSRRCRCGCPRRGR